MPHLACWSCGRQIYTVSPLQSLFAEERRCPRCGTNLNPERRERERREAIRRAETPSVPAPEGQERRAEDRRKARRRRNPADGSNRTGGWTAR
jgi:predicted  nucleic acid-binding Zn-ribbon protein